MDKLSDIELSKTNIVKDVKFTDEKIGSNKLNLEDEVDQELDRLGQGGRWVWTLFFIATLPNILNGFHVSSYVFLGKMPDSFWCEIPALNSSTWTDEQKLFITTDSQVPNSCDINNYDYLLLSSMTYADAWNYTISNERPERVSCLSHPTGQMHYALDGSSIVPEWDLVCENSAWRTLVQVIISLGKCIGAIISGIMSDKFGRKKLFAVGSVLFTLGSLLAIFTPWYWAFLIARFLIGSSAAGIFYAALIMMTENINARHRAWTGIAFNFAYPIGMIYLAVAAIFLPNWRDLQIALTVPVVVLVGFWYYFKESPRWLLSKGRIEQAYQVVFKKPIEHSTKSVNNEPQSNFQNDLQTTVQSKGILFEISQLYRTAKLRRTAFICHFGFFAAAFSYYATAINAVNLSADRVVYVSATGLVDIISYSSSILWVTYVGRKWGCFSYYVLAAVCMLVILAIPQNETTVVVTVAMIGRVGVSAAYAIITLYTTELFPTEVRNSATGVSSMFGHMGSMMAPFVVDFLGEIAWFIPTTICGVGLLLAALLILLNPETSTTKLVDHVGENKTLEITNK